MNHRRFSVRRAVAVFMFVAIAFAVAPVASAASTRANPICIGPLHVWGQKLLDRVCLPTSL